MLPPHVGVWSSGWFFPWARCSSPTRRPARRLAIPSPADAAVYRESPCRRKCAADSLGRHVACFVISPMRKSRLD
jgi:hypothetical protein